MTNTLFLRLEGPLQSWGERARWGVRDTAGEPTKSGIVGLLGCALGLSTDQDLKSFAGQIRLGVRVDRAGERLTDYHTVSGGVMSAEGKVKRNATTHDPETVVSWRTYLCDASFLAAVMGPEDLIDQLAGAVQSPVWPVYLGRKSCPPARPLFEGTGNFESPLQALESQVCRLREPPENGQVGLRVVIEAPPGEGLRRRDETGVNSLRSFLPRYTLEKLVQVPSVAEEE